MKLNVQGYLEKEIDIYRERTEKGRYGKKGREEKAKE